MNRALGLQRLIGIAGPERARQRAAEVVGGQLCRPLKSFAQACPSRNESPPSPCLIPAKSSSVLKIGTHKVCAAVGEAGAKGELDHPRSSASAPRAACARARSPTRTKAGDDIRVALAEAEQQANVEIQEVYLGITGNHIRCEDSKGVHPDRLL
jgi:hypothetical protein